MVNFLKVTCVEKMDLVPEIMLLVSSKKKKKKIAINLKCFLIWCLSFFGGGEGEFDII